MMRGRIAPTPTGHLHMGHGRTFFTAWQRARAAGGELVLRIEDLDPQRCKSEYVDSAIEDLQWMGVDWDGRIVYQSQRRNLYLDAWKKLKDAGLIYPCQRSRKDLRNVALAPHADEEDAEPVFPAEWRPAAGAADAYEEPAGVTWRFLTPENREIEFSDVRKGTCRYTAGKDFGDFVIWRRDDVPAYELAVVVDDIAQGISEVVRGEDLLKSTARQILLYGALSTPPPAWCHEPLVRDAGGKRLAKRHDALSMRFLREQGLDFGDCLESLRA